MTHEQPLISIIIPTYNYGHLIKRCVDSVLDQLQDYHEVILVDDGSTDNTASLLENIKSAHSDKNIYVISKENGGVASARNAGISHTKGRYMLFLDADDELLPHTLEHLDSLISPNQNAKLIIAGHIVQWENGHQRLIRPGQTGRTFQQNIKNYLIKKKFRPVISGATLFHRNIFQNGVFPENFRTGEDIPIFIQALCRYRPLIIESPLVKVHKHSRSLRNQFSYSKSSGLALVEEVFSERRLSRNLQKLHNIKKKYLVQRCLSLFRTALKAGKAQEAKAYYKMAVKQQPLCIFNFRYSKKAARLWLRVR